MPSSASTPSAALQELSEWTTDMSAAIVLGRDGELLAADPDGGQLGPRLRELTLNLLENADLATADPPAEVEVATPAGAVYVVRGRDLALSAVTGRFALSSLTRYDLRRALAGLEGPPR